MKKEAHTIADAVETANTLAVEQWSRGEYDEGCRTLRKLLAKARGVAPDGQLRTSVNLSLCERARGRNRAALKALLKVAHLAERRPGLTPAQLTLRGKFHNGLALCYQYLGDMDRARLEFTAASVYYEDAGEAQLRADVENNLSFLEQQAGNREQAVEHLKRAYEACPRPDALAVWQDTEARLALDEGDTLRALSISLRAGLDILKAGPEAQHLLDDNAPTIVTAVQRYMHEREAARILAALESTNWYIRGAAQLLGMSRQALQNHVKRHFPDINRERLRRNTTVASRR